MLRGLVLKPLLEALTSTGGGRLEIIRDAVERGLFRDLRLVKPALGAIDDVYGEIGELVADKVLPLYGKAILPELIATFDVKGKLGHARRLRLMHAIDEATAREHVKRSLDEGSKEVKVAALECLGGSPEDLAYLIEQASAKAQEVRQAAYRALAGIQDDQAVAVLQKALTGKDLELAADSLRRSKNAKLLSYVIAGARSELEELRKTKEKKAISIKINRLQSLVGCLYQRHDAESEAFTLELFAERDELAKLKGDAASGADLNLSVIGVLHAGTPKMQRTLAESHAVLPIEGLQQAFRAAQACLPMDTVFEMFSPYLTAKVDEKKKQRDPAWARREAMMHALGQDYYFWSHRRENSQPVDPRWLDVAVRLEHLSLVRQLVRPGHQAAEAFLTDSFAAILKKSKSLDDCQECVAGLVYAQAPGAVDAFIAALEKHAGKAAYTVYWFGRLIVDMPKSALPKLEAIVPTLKDQVADRLLDYMQELRDRKE